MFMSNSVYIFQDFLDKLSKNQSNFTLCTLVVDIREQKAYNGIKFFMKLHLNMFFIVRFSNFIFLHQTTQRWVIKHAFFHSLLVQKIFVTTGRITKIRIFSFATLIPPHSLENFKVSSEEKFCSSHVHICYLINTPV